MDVYITANAEGIEYTVKFFVNKVFNIGLQCSSERHLLSKTVRLGFDTSHGGWIYYQSVVEVNRYRVPGLDQLGALQVFR